MSIQSGSAERARSVAQIRTDLFLYFCHFMFNAEEKSDKEERGQRENTMLSLYRGPFQSAFLGSHHDIPAGLLVIL